MTDEEKLCRVVAGWLSYKSLTGLKGLISESSMSIPIGEFLSTSTKHKIVGEHEHPAFKKGSRGRPKQIDFVKLSNGKSGGWISAYECKFQTDTAQRIVDDICRLLCLSLASEEIGNPNRYFVFAGERKQRNQQIDIKINSGKGDRISVFSEILCRDPSEGSTTKKVNVRELAPGQIELFRRFSVDYDSEIPTSFTTDLRGFAIAGEHACSVWRVAPSKGTGMIGNQGLLECKEKNSI